MAPIAKRSLLALGLLLLTALLGIFLLWFLFGPKGFFSSYQSSRQSAYETILIGQSRTQVIEKLGPYRDQAILTFEARALPFFDDLEDRGSFVDLDRKPWFIDFIENPIPEEVAYFLIWNNGSNWYYFIGFSLSGHVVTKGQGHS